MGFIERFVAFSLRQRLFTLLCLAMLVITGLYAFTHLTVEAFPDLTNNQTVVVTDAPGLAAGDVEQRVTYPLETALMGLPGATEVRSISKFGLSIVTVVFEDAVPVYLARQLVNERLLEARDRIPADLNPTLGPVATAFGEIYQYVVEGDGMDLMERKALHDWEIRTRLRSVQGVSEINSWGGLTRQFQVVVDPRGLEKYGIPLRQVFDALVANNQSFTAGFVEHHSERLTVRGLGLLRDAADVENIVLASHGGVAVTIGDVATVEAGPMPRNGAVTRGGRGETVSGMVLMLKGHNGKQVAEAARARLDEIRATLPAGVTIEPFYDQTEVIDRTARTVRNNLIEGSLLVVAVLFLFLRDVRASLIVAAVIPLSMLAGFIGMRAFGVSANLMSLGAIDFGLMVDGAVVMMENFIRRRAAPPPHVRERSAAEARLHFFVSAATEVARPVFFGVLIIVAVYMPVLALEGLEGKMFRPMAITVCSAILGALLLALTVVPAAAALTLDVEKPHHEERWLRRLTDLYGRHLRDALAHRWRTLAVAAGVVAIALASVPFIGTEFMPRLDEGSILIETRKLPSVSLEDSVAISTSVERALLRFPEIRDVVTKIGRPDLATEAMGIYQGDVYISLTPREEWTTAESKEELVEALASALGELPGLEFNFTQPMAMRLDEVVSGVKADVAVKVFGRELETLERVGRDIERVIAGVEGAADVQREVLSGTSQIRIDLDRAAAARYGIGVADVRDVLETAVGGTAVTELRDGARRFAVVVRFPQALRRDAAALGSLVIVAPGGERVPLQRIASLARVPEPETVSHENGERRYVVQANVRGRDIGGFVQEARARVAGQITLPEGYYLEWGGQFENQERASRRLMLLLPSSLLAIFLLLYLMFGRVSQAGLVLLNVPFALVGGIAALWLRGLNLNVSASIGFIALFGIAVLNGVVLVAAVNRLRAERDQPLEETVVQAASARLRPVLMTALVAALGFVPMALSHGAGAEIQRPLATVVIGGIVTSTLLTLVVLPTLYLVIEGRRRGA